MVIGSVWCPPCSVGGVGGGGGGGGGGSGCC